MRFSQNFGYLDFSDQPAAAKQAKKELIEFADCTAKMLKKCLPKTQHHSIDKWSSAILEIPILAEQLDHCKTQKDLKQCIAGMTKQLAHTTEVLVSASEPLLTTLPLKRPDFRTSTRDISDAKNTQTQTERHTSLFEGLSQTEQEIRFAPLSLLASKIYRILKLKEQFTQRPFITDLSAEILKLLGKENTSMLEELRDAFVQMRVDMTANILHSNAEENAAILKIVAHFCEGKSAEDGMLAMEGTLKTLEAELDTMEACESELTSERRLENLHYTNSWIKFFADMVPGFTPIDSGLTRAIDAVELHEFTKETLTAITTLSAITGLVYASYPTILAVIAPTVLIKLLGSTSHWALSKTERGQALVSPLTIPATLAAIPVSSALTLRLLKGEFPRNPYEFGIHIAILLVSILGSEAAEALLIKLTDWDTDRGRKTLMTSGVHSGILFALAYFFPQSKTVDFKKCEALGYSRNMSARDVKRFFRSASRQHHPDQNDAPNASETFQLLVKCKEYLCPKHSSEHP